MNRKDGPEFWREDLARELEQMMAELRAEVLGEYRQQIKAMLRREVEKLVMQVLGPECFGREEEAGQCGGRICSDDFPIGPEVTAMARVSDGQSGGSTCNLSGTGGDLLYTYCFARRNSPDLDGLEGVARGSYCYLVRRGNTAAVVSAVGEEEFGETALEMKLRDAEWVKAKVQAHQRVIEQAMLSGPVIPLKFCTIFRGLGRVEDFLARNAQGIDRLLADLDGMEEWGVKLFCRRSQLFHAVGAGREDEELGSATGAGYLKRKRLERLVEEEAERALDNTAQELFDLLKPVAERSVINEPLSREVTGREEEMIANVVFLLPNSQVAKFCRIIEDFEAKVSDLGLIIEATGPWPPYNFADFREVQNE